MTTLGELVGSSEYPGRGLAIGRDARGVPFAAYWLTGRSAASQQRDVTLADTEIVVQDLSGSATDDLRHYTAAVRGDDWVIVGNGNHVSELAETRGQNVDPQLALRNLAYEPDPPILTPRIAAAADLAGHELRGVVIGSARSYPGAEDHVQHPSLHTARIEPGTAVMTTTYAGTAEQVVTDGQPRTVAVPSGWNSLAEILWDLLNPTLRVAVVVVPLHTGSFRDGTTLTRRAGTPRSGGSRSTR
ncbi:MAG: hypothetical protein QOG10_2095 [Kribbellaceae bacterium]|nr:hypothetical protein [Kribbellaceae bacterium]